MFCASTASTSLSAKTRETILDAAAIMDKWQKKDRVQLNGGSSGEMVH
jgi:hypothetical protein